MGLKRLISVLAVFCVISKVLSREKCPPVVGYMWSFGEYCSVCPVMVFSYKCQNIPTFYIFRLHRLDVTSQVRFFKSKI